MAAAGVTAVLVPRTAWPCVAGELAGLRRPGFWTSAAVAAATCSPTSACGTRQAGQELFRAAVARDFPAGWGLQAEPVARRVAAAPRAWRCVRAEVVAPSPCAGGAGPWRSAAWAALLPRSRNRRASPPNHAVRSHLRRRSSRQTSCAQRRSRGGARPRSSRAPCLAAPSSSSCCRLWSPTAMPPRLWTRRDGLLALSPLGWSLRLLPLADFPRSSSLSLRAAMSWIRMSWPMPRPSHRERRRRFPFWLPTCALILSRNVDGSSAALRRKSPVFWLLWG